MRYDTEHKQRTHQRLIEEASNALRQHGPENISVAMLMAKVGLTHGGFYAHFKSKDDLVAEAITYMLDERLEAFEKSLQGIDLNEALANYIDLYLSTMHLKMRDKGCAVVALNSDIARMSDDTKMRFETGLNRNLDLLTNILIKLNKSQPKSLAATILTEMAGTLAIARAVKDPELSEWLLNNTSNNVKGLLGLHKQGSM